MVKKVNKKLNHSLEDISLRATRWIGTPYSLIIHSLLFAGIFLLAIFGLRIEEILLVLTTAVSLEAIYLAIFIQLTVNRQGQSIEDIQEDVEDISEDVEDISEEIDELQEDEDLQTAKTLNNIEMGLRKVQEALDLLKKRGII